MSVSKQTFSQEYQIFYQEHHTWLISWIRRRLNSTDLAQDITQDTFIDVLVKRRQASLQKPRAYLSSVARNLMVDLFRRRSIEKTYLDSLMLNTEAVHISPEESQSIIETLLELDLLLDSLGERSKQIFLLAQVDGLSYVAISKQLSLSVTTVRKHFIRAMSQCLTLIDDDD